MYKCIGVGACVLMNVGVWLWCMGVDALVHGHWCWRIGVWAWMLVPGCYQMGFGEWVYGRWCMYMGLSQWMFVHRYIRGTDCLYFMYLKYST